MFRRWFSTASLSLLGSLFFISPTLLTVRTVAQERAIKTQQSHEQRSSTRVQENSEEVVRVNTRVVFVDVLVKDKRTGARVTDLTRDNFEILADGKRRTISYFSREGDVRDRPLALVLVLDLRPGGAGRFLRRPEFAESLSRALAKLPPEDEVAVMATCIDGILGKRAWLTKLTRDRAKVAAALATVPNLVGPYPIAPTADMKDVDDQEMKGVVREITRSVTSERPNSQAVMVYVSDDLNTSDLLFTEERNEVSAHLIQNYVIFSALTYMRLKIVQAAVVTLTPLAILGGGSFTGNARHFAKQTGGEAIDVRSPEEYAAGLERIVGDLAARYTLGFTLGEDEADDGRMHRLEVKVNARDARGKARKLIVYARRGYYVPKATAK